MSFSSDVKTELCKEAVRVKSLAVAEAYGVLLYCNTFSKDEVRIITESRPFAMRLQKLFNRAFGFSFDAETGDYDREDSKLSFFITDAVKLAQIFETFGYSPDKMLAHHINLSVLEEEGCQVAFVRGAFLAGGSVTAPEKRYHLELVTDHYNVNSEMFSILLELDTSPKKTSRGGNYVLYFKQSETIEDFLTLLGAPVSAMEIMSMKVEKELRNSVNRRVNCDTANAGKTVEAAAEQMKAIGLIEAGAGLASLPEKLRDTAELRLLYPEASLSELAAHSSPPITKSCLNHRIRKLIEISKLS